MFGFHPGIPAQLFGGRGFGREGVSPRWSVLGVDLLLFFCLLWVVLIKGPGAYGCE